MSNYVSSHRFSPAHKEFLAALNVIAEPSHLFEALAHSHSQEAMQHEINALERNKIWILTPLRISKKTLGCKWVFKIQTKV